MPLDANIWFNGLYKDIAPSVNIHHLLKMKFSFIISLVFAIALTDLTVAWTSAVEIRKNMERCQKISLDECPAARKCAIEECT